MADIPNETKSDQEADVKYAQQSSSSSHEFNNIMKKQKRERAGKRKKKIGTSVESEIRSQEVWKETSTTLN